MYFWITCRTTKLRSDPKPLTQPINLILALKGGVKWTWCRNLDILSSYLPTKSQSLSLICIEIEEYTQFHALDNIKGFQQLTKVDCVYCDLYANCELSNCFPGLVVMGECSCLRCHELESLHQIVHFSQVL